MFIVGVNSGITLCLLVAIFLLVAANDSSIFPRFESVKLVYRTVITPQCVSDLIFQGCHGNIIALGLGMQLTYLGEIPHQLHSHF